MKKMIVLIALFMGIFGKTVMANDDVKVNRVVKEAFEKRFPAAKDAVWQQLKYVDAYKVTFLYKEQPFIGYMGMDGEVLGFIRSVMNEKLPFLVDEAIKTKYVGFKIKSAEEMVSDKDEVSYIFAVEDDKACLYLRTSIKGHITVMKKIKK